MHQIRGAVGYSRVYWVDVHPTFMRKHGWDANEVTSPPGSGWASCFVMDDGAELSRVRLLCPHTMTSYEVSRRSAEFKSLKPHPMEAERATAYLTSQWEMFSRLGMQRDYDQAARFMVALGVRVPTASAARDTNKVRGGKEVARALSRPIRRESRRGQVLDYFMRNQGASALAAMETLSMTRSNVLSHLHVMRKDHGVGYVVKGDAITVQLPEGCEDPWATQ